MTTWLHTTILATSIVATAAVGFASAAIITSTPDAIGAAKADRLPVAAEANGYVTLETRADGVSVLARVPVN